MKRNLDELKLEHEYQLRLKDMSFSEKLKDVSEKYSQEIEALKILTSALRSDKDKLEIKNEEEYMHLKSVNTISFHVILNHTP